MSKSLYSILQGLHLLFAGMKQCHEQMYIWTWFAYVIGVYRVLWSSEVGSDGEGGGEPVCRLRGLKNDDYSLNLENTIQTCTRI